MSLLSLLKPSRRATHSPHTSSQRPAFATPAMQISTRKIWEASCRVLLHFSAEVTAGTTTPSHTRTRARPYDAAAISRTMGTYIWSMDGLLLPGYIDLGAFAQ
jgi:hypothetical protein